MNKAAKLFLAIIIPVSLSGVAVRGYFTGSKPMAITPADPAALQNANLYNKHSIDSAISLLRSGYVVLRTGLGADSYLLSQMNQKDKTYSHCGIVMVEHGYPFVYHSIGGEDNPDERLRRDSASFFFSPLHNSGLAIVSYKFDADMTGKLRQVVTQYYRQRPKFDMKFDLKTDDKLYCAEFVYKAINKATDDPQYIGTTSVLGCTFAGVDDLFVNPHAHIVWKTRYK